MATIHPFHIQKVATKLTAGDVTDEVRRYALNSDLSNLLSDPRFSEVSGQTVASTMDSYINSTDMSFEAMVAAITVFLKSEQQFAVDQVDDMIAQLQAKKKHYVALAEDLRSFVLTEMENRAYHAIDFQYAGTGMTVSIVNPAPATTIGKEPDDQALKMYPTLVNTKHVWDKKKVKAMLNEATDQWMHFARAYECEVVSTPTIKINFASETP